MCAPVRGHPGNGNGYGTPLCDDGGSHIMQLGLYGDLLHGSISPALGSLTHLTLL